MSHDWVVCGGTVVTAEKTFRADIGNRGEQLSSTGKMCADDFYSATAERARRLRERALP